MVVPRHPPPPGDRRRALVAGALAALATFALTRRVNDAAAARTAAAVTAALNGASAARPPPRRAAAPKCAPMEHTDYWGDALKWGPDHLQPSAAACCAACAAYEPPEPGGPACTVWVYCADAALCGASLGQCWLKHLAWPEAVNPRTGPDVPWTSGLASGGGAPRAADVAQVGGRERAYHVVITAAGTAVHWQSRVHYYHYVKQRAACRARWGGRCQMGGFTRILHTGAADDLMAEIPTFVARPLDGANRDDGYVVLNRPWAVVQWLRDAPPRERFVLMGEPDHLWRAPLPNPTPAAGTPAAFPFFYIEPSKAEYRPLTEAFTGPLTLVEAERVPPVGNAPTIVATADLAALAPLWMATSLAVFDHPPARKAWGWVLEMYGFAIALFLGAEGRACVGCADGTPTVAAPSLAPVTLVPRLMAQPPWDADAAGTYILHYTYGVDHALNGSATPGVVGEWRFDKRTYAAAPPPRGIPAPPPAVAAASPAAAELIAMINEATDAIPGWDAYAESGVAGEVWDGRL